MTQRMSVGQFRQFIEQADKERGAHRWLSHDDGAPPPCASGIASNLERLCLMPLNSCSALTASKHRRQRRSCDTGL